MIVNSSVITGFLKVRIEGMYFGLVSCSGIVKVTLWNAGSHVLESKMWVGMNLPQAIPFDEIQIESEIDQPVEFWAGKTPMTQNIGSFKGASAIRTSISSVLGSAAITGSDLTRQSVRVRANKEVFIGGAGVNGTGWRLPADKVEEIPVAGVLYAFKPLPTLDIGQSSFVSQHDEMFPSATMTAGKWWVSDDGNTRLSWNASPSSGALMIWTEESQAWVKHPHFNGTSSSQFGVIHDIETDTIYAIRSIARNVSGGGGSNADGEMYLHKSVDNGRTFKSIKSIDWGAITNHALINNSFTELFLNIVDNVLSISMSGLAVGVDLGSLEIEAYAAGERTDNTGTDAQNRYWIQNWCFLDNTFQRALVRDYVAKKVLLTEDGGKTFSDFLSHQIDFYRIAPNGKHLIYKQSSTNRGWLVDVADMMPLQIPDFGAGNGRLPTNVYNGVWAGVYGGKLSLFYRSGDEVKKEQTLDSNNINYGYVECLTKPDGTVWRLASSASAGFYIADKWHLSITGDLTPAKVEVMELLS